MERGLPPAEKGLEAMTVGARRRSPNAHHKVKNRILISGRYRLVNKVFLREKAKRDDPRHIVYAAMLANETYEDYLAQVGQTKVYVNEFDPTPLNGRREILYARVHGWIEDA